MSRKLGVCWTQSVNNSLGSLADPLFLNRGGTISKIETCWTPYAAITIEVTMPTLARSALRLLSQWIEGITLSSPVEGACSAALPIESAAHVMSRADFT